MRIKATIHSDDWRLEERFDAVFWFRYASESEVLALIGCDFGGSYAADQVAIQCDTDGVRRVLRYCEVLRDAGHDMGFEVYVDEDSAFRWLMENRPSWLEVKRAYNERAYAQESES